MKVISTVRELQEQIKSSGKSSVGFVPTMGALHQGHLSLVRNAIDQCPLVVVSIYVNPTQFNDREDLKNYPRTLNMDLELLGSVMREADLVFTPGDREIYPYEDKRVFRFGNLDNVMEALQRPGHFNGVGQVVSKLFEIVKPDIAYFGQKDFQQLAVVKELVRQTGRKVTITGNPIIREEDGLAMSSRNRLLEPGIRKNAGIIYRTIMEASMAFGKMNISELKEFVRKKIEKTDGFSVEYFEIADDMELMPVSRKEEMRKDRRYFACIAVKAGKIRLIDNIEIPL
ncbi:MAG: pantoate--beta-alanine ligase [Bacteroidales bacterium]